MRGRKPLPTALKLVRGNPGRYPLNLNEPTYPPVESACPDELIDPVARSEWARIVPLLAARGHVTTVDRATMTGYCLKYAQWLALEVEAAKHPFILRGARNSPIANPALKLANHALLLLLRASAELGLTPSTRSRIVATTQPADDAFSRFQQRRPPTV